MIDFVNEAGIGAIGTAEDAKAQVRRLVEQSNGGFGGMLLLGPRVGQPGGHQAVLELIAQHVFPEFQNQEAGTLAAAARAADTHDSHSASQMSAVDHMTAKYQKELADKG